MGPILDSIDKLIESRNHSEHSVSQTIAARDRMDKDLLDLLVTIDNKTYDLCQNGGNYEELVSLASNKSTDIYESLKESDIDPRGSARLADHKTSPACRPPPGEEEQAC